MVSTIDLSDVQSGALSGKTLIWLTRPLASPTSGESAAWVDPSGAMPGTPVHKAAASAARRRGLQRLIWNDIGESPNQIRKLAGPELILARLGFRTEPRKSGH